MPEGYSPSNDEEFMNDQQLEFFRQKLLNWKLELLEEATDTKGNLSAEGLQRPDIADRAKSNQMRQYNLEPEIERES